MVALTSGSSNYPTRHELLQPQEELMECERKQQQFVIGIPREDYKGENRVCLAPQSVEFLVTNGHEVLIETGAGLASNFTDKEFSDYGAIIVNTKEEVLQADVVLQMTPFSEAEIDMLRGNQLLISTLQCRNQCLETIQKLKQKRVTALALELMKDCDNHYPVVRSMSEIGGIASIMIAGEYLSKSHGGKGILLGGVTGISPTEIVILGAGTVAEYATRSALGLGASVKVFDSSLYRLRRLEDHLGHRVFTSIYHPQTFEKAMSTADVVIGAIRYDHDRPHFMVTEEMVQKMKKDSIIVDLNIDQGGCFETSMPTTHKRPVFDKFGVLHYCVPNIPSRVAKTATLAMSNICAPLLMNIAAQGGIHKYVKNNKGIRSGIYIYRGILTNRKLADHLGLMSKDIELLVAAM
jgi:alanine dehydrogenase